jgi:hypothetical protein
MSSVQVAHLIFQLKIHASPFKVSAVTCGKASPGRYDCLLIKGPQPITGTFFVAD